MAHNALMKASGYEIAYESEASNVLHEDHAKFRNGMDKEEMEELERNVYNLKKLNESSLSLRKTRDGYTTWRLDILESR